MTARQKKLYLARLSIQINIIHMALVLAQEDTFRNV
jgi:hypothetical protein